MRVAMICARPYGVFNCVSFVLQCLTDDEVDLYLLELEQLEDIRADIKETGIFKNIFLFVPTYKMGGDVKGFINMFLPRMGMHYICPELPRNMDLYYDIIISIGYYYPLYYLSTINPKSKIFMLDEGTESYRLSCDKENEKSWKIRLLGKLNRGYFSIKIDRYYLYEKRLAVEKYRWPIYDMPKVTDKVSDIEEAIFGVSNNIYEGKKIIYFADIIEDEKKIYEDKNEEILLRYLEEKYFDLTIVRNHPASNTKLKTTLLTDTDNTTWEIQSRYIEEDAILIGRYSSAQMTPYLIYGKGNPVIYLFKLLPFGKNNRSRVDGTQDITEYIEREIKFKTNNYMPETLEDVLGLIEDFVG